MTRTSTLDNLLDYHLLLQSFCVSKIYFCSFIIILINYFLFLNTFVFLFCILFNKEDFEKFQVRPHEWLHSHSTMSDILLIASNITWNVTQTSHMCKVLFKLIRNNILQWFCEMSKRSEANVFCRE